MTIVIKSGSKVNTAKVIKRFADRSAAKADKAIRWTAIAMFRDVIIESPVDSGRFRANWYTTVGQASIKTTTSIKRDAMMPMIKRVESAKNGAVFFLTNNLPYSVALENGHSGQAPRGMARRAVARGPGYLKKAVKRFN